MDTNLTERLEDLLKDAEEGFTLREILDTAAISEYAHVDVRHVLGAIAYKQQDQRWRLKTIKLPVTRNVVPKVEKTVKPVKAVEPKEIKEPSTKTVSVKTKEPSTKTVSVKTKEPSTKTVSVKTKEPSTKTVSVKTKEPRARTVSTDSILTYLRNHPEGVTHTILAERLNVQKSVLAAKLKALVDSKQIVRFRFRIGHYQGRNQPERFFLAEHENYVALHLQLSFIKDQVAKLGFTVTMKLEEFPDVKF
jgi:hypothetical protein